MNKLHVDSVIKSFYTKQVLSDVYISCGKGDIIGLLGRNGSGKSTLLKIVFGSLPADRKFVKVGDKIISGLFNSNKFIKFLPQDGFLPDHVKSKILIDLLCNKTNAALIKEHVLIKPMLDKKSKELSSGEKRILEIFISVFSDSIYTFIDEPFSGVAPIYKDEIKEIIKKQTKNKGFIITDHDYRNILEIANRVIVMHDGSTKEIKSIEELKYWGYLT